MKVYDPETEKKIEQLEREIQQMAQEQCDQIDQELQSYQEYHSAKNENDALQHAYRLMDTQLRDQIAKNAAEVAKQKADCKRRLYLKRGELLQRLFDQAKAELVRFTASDAYPAFLLNKAKKIAATVDCNGAVLQLRQQDLSFAAELEQICTGCTVKACAQIQIGGLLLVSEQSRFRMDETLDQALYEQNEWFVKHSGLIVTLGPAEHELPV